MNGLKPVHVAALYSAPLGTVYLLSRMSPTAVLHLEPIALGQVAAAAAEAVALSPRGSSEPPGKAAARCAIL